VAIGLACSCLISDLACGALADTLVGFHITPTLPGAVPTRWLGLGDQCDQMWPSCRAFVGGASGVWRAGRSQGEGRLPWAITGIPEDQQHAHGLAIGEAIALVDLDTVNQAGALRTSRLSAPAPTRWGRKQAIGRRCA